MTKNKHPSRHRHLPRIACLLNHTPASLAVGTCLLNLLRNVQWKKNNTPVSTSSSSTDRLSSEPYSCFPCCWNLPLNLLLMFNDEKNKHPSRHHHLPRRTIGVGTKIFRIARPVCFRNMYWNGNLPNRQLQFRLATCLQCCRALCSDYLRTAETK